MAELLRVINEQSIRVEAGAIVTWCYSQHSQERSPHGVWASKPTLPRDLLQSSADLLQPTTSRLDTDTLDEVGRGPPHIAAKTRLKFRTLMWTRAASASTERSSARCSAKMQITQWTAVCDLQFQEGAELRLASRSS